VKTDVGQVDLVLRLSDGTSEKIGLIAIDFSQNSPHFSLLSPTSPYELSLREVTSPSNLKVMGALDNYSLVL
jgi:hypothetical protein